MESGIKNELDELIPTVIASPPDGGEAIFYYEVVKNEKF